RALARGSRNLTVHENRWNDQTCEVPDDELALLRALTRVNRSRHVARIVDCIPVGATPHPGASLNVIRTTFETDRIPPAWHVHLEQFDEVWVFSQFNRRAFIRSGVPPERIRVVPSFLDTELFCPDGPKLELPKECDERFVFLSVFDWLLRKGWDVLLRAYATT